MTQTTSGNFSNEKETEDFFDSKINSQFFVIEKQIKGRRLFDDKFIQSNQQNLILDRLLHPISLCYQKGWRFGPVGVELKKSNIAVGGIFAQVLEQRQSLFLSRFLNNTRIIPSFFAIFPLDQIHGNMHSLLHAQLIMACHYHDHTKTIRFTNGNQNILKVGKELVVSDSWRPSTRKGHRGLEK